MATAPRIPRWEWPVRITVIVGVLVAAFSQGHLSIALLGLGIVLVAGILYLAMRIQRKRRA